MTQYTWTKGEQFGGSSRPLKAQEQQDTRCAAGLFSWHFIRHEEDHERASGTERLAQHLKGRPDERCSLRGLMREATLSVCQSTVIGQEKR